MDVDSIHPGAVWGPCPSPPPGWTWEQLMDRALELAAANEEAGEVPVGAVVVSQDGSIVGEGVNAPLREHDPSAHAEIQALRAAGRRLKNYRLGGCVMVVTLEPCLMCVGALVHARLAGVIFGAVDRKAGAVVSCIQGLELPQHTHRVWHMGGIQGQACAAVLRHFFYERRAE